MLYRLENGLVGERKQTWTEKGDHPQLHGDKAMAELAVQSETDGI